MSHRVCPWWLGYLLASPLRRLFTKPEQLLSRYIQPGMTVLEPGPGMGFFTLPIAKMVGPSGRVVAIDVQQKMIDGLKRRAEKAGVGDRIDARVAGPETLGISDLAGQVDFTLAFYVVHEFPEGHPCFREVAATSKQGAMFLVSEPTGHVDDAFFASELKQAEAAGFAVAERPNIRRSKTVLLRKM
ncbi:MAG TPA: class I SAM-dependent methyltransferase [Terriglobales bacterium]|nr:class I SAM-dependent methyltransferase [Terriglobales bacterium]